MSENSAFYSNRHHALAHAVEVHRITGAAGPDVLTNAAAFYEFLESGKNAAPAADKSPASSTATTESAKSSAGAASPKGKRRAAAPATTPAATESAAAASTETANASPSEEDDLFGGPKAEAATTAATSTKAAESSSTSAPKKEKKLVLDDVRAQLVEVQTNCGGKDAVHELLKQFTTGGVTIISKLPEENFAKIIAAAKAKVAAATTAK